MTLRSPEALADAGLVAPDRIASLEPVAVRYAVAVTPAMAALIDPADPTDPIARQFLPDLRELAPHPLDRADPTGDEAHTPVKGIVHRYPDRVLLMPTHACAVYCRFCFRREVVGPGGEGSLTAAELDAAFAYIAGRPEVWEVIVTGGDPLVLSPRRLRDLSARVAAIPHVKVLRWHTRVPVVDPEGVTPELVAALTGEGLATYLAVHANHPRELTPAARGACARLAAAGVSLVSQSVLLRGVNDDPEVLGALMRAFVEAGVKPYYLHHPDLAPGTAHLRVSLEEGRPIVSALRGRLSGLCQPTYVLDIPGGYGKVPIDLDKAEKVRNLVDQTGRQRHSIAQQSAPEIGNVSFVQDPWGGVHAYPPAAS